MSPIHKHTVWSARKQYNYKVRGCRMRRCLYFLHNKKWQFWHYLLTGTRRSKSFCYKFYQEIWPAFWIVQRKEPQLGNQRGFSILSVIIPMTDDNWNISTFFFPHFSITRHLGKISCGRFNFDTWILESRLWWCRT